MPAPSNMPKALQQLSAHLNRLPGIGRRTAERLALALLEWPEEKLAAFGEDLKSLRQKVHPCAQCGNYTEDELCCYCASADRQRDIICVVENATQIQVIENSNVYRGLYHVLGGKLSPLNGKGPDDLRIRELRNRLEQSSVAELILATSPDLEGEATAHFIAEEFRDLSVTITRIAAGIPAGADLGNADAATLGLALNGRRQFQ